MVNLCLALLSTLLLSGCVAGVLEIEIPFTEGQIVANGFVGPAGTRLQLTRSLNPNDTAFLDNIPPVEGAEVTLNFANGQTETLSETAPGTYTSPVGVAPGTKVSMEIVPFPGNSGREVKIPDINVPEDLERVLLTVESTEVNDNITDVRYIPVTKWFGHNDMIAAQPFGNLALIRIE
jgi:hypothetical protein